MHDRGSMHKMCAFARYALSFGVLLLSTETLVVRAATKRPNVLMVVLDDVGWQDVGFHDDTFHTPHIDRLASEGIELTAFYASPECTPARSQLMTGRYNYKVSTTTAAAGSRHIRHHYNTITVMPSSSTVIPHLPGNKDGMKRTVKHHVLCYCTYTHIALPYCCCCCRLCCTHARVSPPSFSLLPSRWNLWSSVRTASSLIPAPRINRFVT